jgi:acyl carrier protein
LPRTNAAAAAVAAVPGPSPSAGPSCGRAPGADLDLDATFTDLGLDSRMAVALRTSVARATGRVLPTTLLFDHPTPAALIEALRSDDTKVHEFR